MNGFVKKSQALALCMVASGCLAAFGQAHADGLFPPDAGPGHSWQQAAPWAPANPNGTPDYNEDLGPLGKWSVGGGIDFLASTWTNSADGPKSSHYGLTFPNAIVILNGTKGKFRLRLWAGLPPLTPIVGWTGPGLNPNLHQAGSAENPYGHASELFKGYITYSPTDWFDVDVGRIDSVDGTEIGVSWFNPTPMVSPLNNMQSTTADGIQFDFHHGPGSLSIQLGDGYNTGQISQLGALGQYSLNDDGSDSVIVFGHHRLRTAGDLGYAGHVASFGVVNSNLVGLGGMWTINHKYAISPEVEYQWLPKGITGGGITSATAPQTTYSNTAAMIDFTDQVNSYWQSALQVSYVHQHGNTAQGNTVINGVELNNIYGNYLGLGAPNGAGNLGQGSDMLGVQVGGTWMYKNLFVRPFLVFTHLTHFEPGNGWGRNGDKSSQVVALIDIGWLFGDVKRN
ncbi:MAG: hypothetical protein EPN41_13080 [Candidimonas sp.]|nr:MAG: hypothetical protein EPN41_13080 [Candidimonas sp.]